MGAKKQSAKKNLLTLLKALEQGPAPDPDDWVEAFFVALKTRIAEVDAAEEVVLFYLATELVEYEVNNGGFAQTFMNLGIESQWEDWAIQGYALFEKPQARDLLVRAAALGRKEQARIEKAAESLESASAYFKRKTFAALDREAGKAMFISSAERMELVRKNQTFFAAL